MIDDGDDDSGICVDRCVCFNRTFVDIKAVADRDGIRTLPQLMEAAEFGLSCQTCHAYVNEMLRTGETVFTRLLPEPEL